MEKKGVIVVPVVLLALMIAAAVYGVSRLYSDTPGRKSPTVVRSGVDPALAAVPTDAVAVFCFDGSARAKRIAADTTGLLRAFIGQDGKFMRYVWWAAEERTAVSLHNSGTLVPLAVTRLRKADSLSVATFTAKAAAAGLHSDSYEGFFIASSSETLVSSARRHLDTGMSILSSDGLEDLSSRLSGPLVVYLCNSQASRLVQNFASQKLRSRADELRDMAPWTGFAVKVADRDAIVAEGSTAVPEAPSSFVRAMSQAAQGTNSYAEALPYFTDYAVSVPVGDPKSFIDARLDYMDSRGEGKAYKERVIKKGRHQDMTPREWAEDLHLAEIVKASFVLDGTPREVILLRSGKPLKLKAPEGNPHRGYVSALMGEDFAVDDTLMAPLLGKWIVMGDIETVKAYCREGFLDYPLLRRMSDSGVRPGSGYVFYGSLTEAPYLPGEMLSERVATPLADYVNGAAYAPAVFAVEPSSPVPFFSLSVEKKAMKGDNIKMQDRDTTVTVPSGPWTVTNSSTGKQNTFYQNDHLSLCLNDETGKGMWGVPFKKKVAGFVTDIDYYQNGRIQFLFAAGDQLYLMDRLGRFVNGFPVRLPGGEVLLGPQVHDFTGAGGYTAMVLHTDNTIGMYNLHGESPAEWKGIAPPETVKELPRLVETGGNRYWAVRTSIRTLIYPFYGGQTLTPAEGGKMIRPDSRLEPTSKGGLTVDCYNGKSMDIKL